jgi:hypothetical protein
LPWGTDSEKQIPKRIAREAEFELARSQLATQTPTAEAAAITDASLQQSNFQETQPADDQIVFNRVNDPHADPFGEQQFMADGTMLAPPEGEFDDEHHVLDGEVVSDPSLPANWPDSTDLIPDPPAPERPSPIINREPVMTHTRLYRGDDPYFTNRLSDYVETGDDARPEGWQGYVKRSDDFVRFCCHLHITEMLESRGGRDESDLILRWPLSRY